MGLECFVEQQVGQVEDNVKTEDTHVDHNYNFPGVNLATSVVSGAVSVVSQALSLPSSASSAIVSPTRPEEDVPNLRVEQTEEWNTGCALYMGLECFVEKQVGQVEDNVKIEDTDKEMYEVVSGAAAVKKEDASVVSQALSLPVSSVPKQETKDLKSELDEVR